jgi:hypothetical protein
MGDLDDARFEDDLCDPMDMATPMTPKMRVMQGFATRRTIMQRSWRGEPHERKKTPAKQAADDIARGALNHGGVAEKFLENAPKAGALRALRDRASPALISLESVGVAHELPWRAVTSTDGTKLIFEDLPIE